MMGYGVCEGEGVAVTTYERKRQTERLKNWKLEIF